MTFWANLIGYQIVWFGAVIGASRGNPWWGVVLSAGFVLIQAWGSDSRRADLRLVAVALYLGLALDGLLAASGWALAMWILCRLARRWERNLRRPAGSITGGAT